MGRVIAALLFLKIRMAVDLAVWLQICKLTVLKYISIYFVLLCNRAVETDGIALFCASYMDRAEKRR